MNYEKDIQKLVDETLGSLDGLQKAAPQPYLFTRVMARMQREENTIWEKMASLISRPVVVFAMVILFLVINVAVFLQVSGSGESPVAEEPVLMAGNDYGLTVSSLYDLNPEQNDVVKK
jgi:1-acyl-sn-glycerol-3-phosphate acyltransferase